MSGRVEKRNSKARAAAKAARAAAEAATRAAELAAAVNAMDQQQKQTHMAKATEIIDRKAPLQSIQPHHLRMVEYTARRRYLEKYKEDRLRKLDIVQFTAVARKYSPTEWEKVAMVEDLQLDFQGKEFVDMWHPYYNALRKAKRMRHFANLYLSEATFQLTGGLISVVVEGLQQAQLPFGVLEALPDPSCPEAEAPGHINWELVDDTWGSYPTVCGLPQYRWCLINANARQLSPHVAVDCDVLRSLKLGTALDPNFARHAVLNQDDSTTQALSKLIDYLKEQNYHTLAGHEQFIVAPVIGAASTYQETMSPALQQAIISLHVAAPPNQSSSWLWAFRLALQQGLEDLLIELTKWTTSSITVITLSSCNTALLVIFMKGYEEGLAEFNSIVPLH